MNSEIKTANTDTIFIIDGTFLFKKDLYKLFDFKSFVETDFEIVRKRGAKREEPVFGSFTKAEGIFLKRYHVVSKLYLEQHTPQLNAYIIINLLLNFGSRYHPSDSLFCSFCVSSNFLSLSLNR